MNAHTKFLAIVIALLACTLSSNTVSSADRPAFEPGKLADQAPAELKHWSKLIGQWSTTEEGLKPDGSGWQASKGADWEFFWAFDGWGIQDNYTSPPRAEKLEDESKRQRGTNLRIYNPDTKQWVMTWLTPVLAKPQNYTATSTPQHITMLGDFMDSRGNYHRITFFDMTENSFEWKLEWSKDHEKWLKVYRIHGTKKQS